MPQAESRMSEADRHKVQAEPCRCVRCVMCSGTGTIDYDTRLGTNTESCEDCDNGIAEACGRCQLLADMDMEWATGRSELK